MRNKEACKNITDLFFNRMSKIFDSYEKLYDASLRTEEESIIFNEALNTTVDVHIKQLSVNDIVIEDNVKVKLVLFTLQHIFLDIKYLIIYKIVNPGRNFFRGFYY